ncbi:NAD(P)/FAD-dependent oxidoreductase [Pseudosulfitobacter pseudonitzschiae]|uniref:NAD(P)/FAD-dependent oxidoreductase n=1 Tax=Pseudosulfitobacter pseudonitzschiae TaxID=1402135 RepID=UPI001AF4D753|nr:FAD-binding oxidoreductase [Pseudosulfitobacter pseudonitzschiae]MBM1815712.1 FAD-binding oxidoreductase [Pseudosulfitobacter pseudonitzschiae]MBM1832703.1 FAD-binding oxidoreductase [Pseudosulfitobacter pseudonitzschiae]MBM1837571.1 FAD-binding oxidoreductase [Pseudosulfitobacter pseudonitzschiae]MBM1842417.1 FAD-binding oxidoreductase [Pseudosulfitobacter pseudonitzschiae]MBM1847285.1 FAD-binding oxidoreductase [Pseudosulfitobacter pseudonitzschiae]
MKHIYADYAYGNGPRDGCWWDETCDLPDFPKLETDIACDVAIVGGGFTGLSAALHLAQAGVDVVVVEAEYVGWGASGRNGGFCCLGGARIDDAGLDRRFGRVGRLQYRKAERDAIALVEQITQAHGIDVDRHSQGETELAHRPKDMDALRRAADAVAENHGVDCQIIAREDLPAHGLSGPFHGALTIPIGFGLNPRKYIAGLAAAARDAGARIFGKSPVQSLNKGQKWTLVAGRKITADQVVIATNGYSSDDLPDWLAGRYMPSQSNVIVTRSLTEQEQADAGWTSDQACYDTRNLLHYFRKMPDGRFLFGMRGGLTSNPAAEARARRRVRQDFDAMFPAWRHVEHAHGWSGMVCIARDMLPFVGAVPNQPGLFASLCYHGNGVAMGTYAGKLIAGKITGQAEVPVAMAQPLSRFPLGPYRRAVMPAAYAGFMLADL